MSCNQMLLSMWSTGYQSLSRLKYWMYLVLLLQALLPTLYTTVRVNLLGNLPTSHGIDIASQAQWVGIFFEVLQESLLMPIYFTMGKTISCPKETVNKVKTGLVIISGTFLCCCLILDATAKPLVYLMAQQEASIDQTIRFIRVEVFSFFFNSLNKFLQIILLLLNMDRGIMVAVIVKTFFTILLDIVFLSDYTISLQLGVMGVAFSNIITNIINFLIFLAFLVAKLSPTADSLKKDWNFSWVLTWSKVGLYSGLDSIFRNVTYMLVILRSMNQLEAAGLYWTTNTFIWSWLLLPFLPWTELLRVAISSSPAEPHWKKMAGYVILTALIVILWLISLPGWRFFFSKVLNSSSPLENLNLALILLPFYILFMFNSLMDSVFYGLGRTELMAIQSFICNVIIIVPFILNQANVIPLNVTNIALIFGGGIALDSLITLRLYMGTLKKCNYLI